jgi:hypothetical protein
MRFRRARPCLFDAGIAQLGSPAFGLGECRLGPLGNHLAFALRDGCQYMDGEAGGLRYVAGDEIRPGFHQVGDECHVAGEAVQTGNEKYGAALAAFSQSGKELGPVGVPSAALDLGVFGDELAGANESGDGLTP